MRRLLTYICVGMTLAILLPAQAEEPPFTQHQLHHDASRAELEGMVELKEAEILKAYGSALDDMVSKAQAAANFEAATSGVREQQRFAASKDIPLQAAANNPAWLTRLQAPYRNSLAQLEKLAQQKQQQISQKYLAQLEPMQAEFVRQGNLKSAGQVHAEMGRVKKLLASGSSPATGPGHSPTNPGVQDGFYLPAQGKGWVYGAMNADLVLYLRFDSPADTDFPDHSGQHHPAGRTNAAWHEKGYLGGAIEFTGGDNSHLWIRNLTNPDKPVMYTGPRMDNGMTVSTYFYITRGKGGEYRSLVANSENSGMMIALKPDHYLEFIVRSGKGFRTVAAPYRCKPETWYHAAGVFDKTSVKLFVNGSLVAEKPVTSGEKLINSKHRLMIGANPGKRNRPNAIFQGRMDEVAVWERALSDREIRFLYNGR